MEASDVPSTPSHLPVTGFDRIDKDHLCFLGLLDGLRDAVREGRGEKELPEFLVAFEHYARLHFGREEQLMSLIGYPGLGAHVSSHRGLTGRLERLRDRQTDGDPALPEEVLAFLLDWLDRHIREEDAAFVPYLQGLEGI